MEEEKQKIIIPLHKELLKSEREELKATKRKKWLLAFICLLFLSLGIGIGYFGNFFVHRKQKLESIRTLQEIEFIMDNYWLYGDDYEDLNTMLEDKALYGMTTYSFDPFTSYMSYDEKKQFASSINMNYVGIGVEYALYDDIAMVTKVFYNSPAYKGGMQVGDIIKTVDGTPIEGLATSQIKELVVGESGTHVLIEVNRDNKKITLDLIRHQIDSSVFVSAKEDYVYVELNSFGDNTGDTLADYLKQYTDYEKIIIDLRNNGGGYQSSVQQIAGEFIGDHKVYMIQADKNGNEYTDYTKTSVVFDNFKKVIILTNRNTASAAEVLTICLKESLDDVTIVGETTYGKGVIQSNLGLYNGGSIKVTAFKWLSPNGVWINGEGIHPDIEVLQDPVTYEKIYVLNDETYKYDSVSNYSRMTQLGLRFLGYDIDRTDGYFDHQTEDAIVAYKMDRGFENIEPVIDEEFYNSLISSTTRAVSFDKDKDYQLSKAIELIKE